MNGFNFESAKKAIEENIPKATEMLKDKSKINDLLSKIENIPVVGKDLSQVPTMISMVKNYITGEYQETSTKTIAIIVAAFIYIVKKDDIIDDKKGLFGYADDLAVFVVALKWIRKDLDKFKTWKANFYFNFNYFLLND